MAAVEQLHAITPEQFGEFEEWSSATSSDGCLDDWSDFNDSRSWEEDRPASPVLAQKSTETSEQSAESIDAGNPWDVFRECFPRAEEGAIGEPGDRHTPTLAELMRGSSNTQPGVTGSRAVSVSVCSRLVCEGSSVRLSGPKPHTHSLSQLLSTLPLLDPKTHNTQEDMALPDMELEKTEDPPAALIQTKLLAPSFCHEPPPFLYQVSLRWLRQWNIQLQAHNPAKGLLQ
ncbi:hypothetical protein ACEWY4_004954 [Coilia grayii]|uniref:Uncharacterized protein n=1 Tax=Coilia grayii TaxID=363190 RepID=A0ABD1KGY0_9TELE